MGSGARTKGYLKNYATGQIKPFLYNPSSINIDRGVIYNEIKSAGCSYPKYQYVGGEAKTVSFDLFLYSDKGEIESFINFLESFTPIEDSRSKFAKPPYILFAFGIFVKKCILISYKRQHTMFTDTLGYKIAVLSIELKVVA